MDELQLPYKREMPIDHRISLGNSPKRPRIPVAARQEQGNPSLNSPIAPPSALNIEPVRETNEAPHGPENTMLNHGLPGEIYAGALNEDLGYNDFYDDELEPLETPQHGFHVYDTEDIKVMFTTGVATCVAVALLFKDSSDQHVRALAHFSNRYRGFTT